MQQYQLTKQAQQDIFSIRRYTEENWGKLQSKNYLQGLNNTFRLLAEMPSMGEICTDDLDKNVLCFLHKSHVIYYFNMPKGLTIIAILHQSMIPRNHLKQRF